MPSVIREEKPISGLEDYRAPIEMGKAEILEKGKEIAILAVGNMVRTAVQVTENLRNCGYEPTLVNMRFVKPLDMDLLEILSRGSQPDRDYGGKCKVRWFRGTGNDILWKQTAQSGSSDRSDRRPICSAWKCGRSDASAADGQCICDRENSSMERRTTEKY